MTHIRHHWTLAYAFGSYGRHDGWWTYEFECDDCVRRRVDFRFWEDNR